MNYKMLIVLFRSVIIVGLIMAYSVGVWQFINDYFGHEFKVYLDREIKNDPYIKLIKNGTDGFCDAVTIEDVFKFIGRALCWKKDDWIEQWSSCASENYKINSCS